MKVSCSLPAAAVSASASWPWVAARHAVAAWPGANSAGRAVQSQAAMSLQASPGPWMARSTDNSPAFNNVILSWTTYPERLEQAGISWQVYQEEDNFDDNALAWFTQYATAPASSPLRQRGIAFGRAGDFEADARADRLPQVSWLVAP